MATQIERNAEVVADLAGSDWQMAYVIACSVQIGAGNGRPKTSGTPEVSEPKVGALAFARKVKAASGGNVYGLGENGIAARLRRWDELAEQYGFRPSAALKPEDANEYPAFPRDVPFQRENGAAGQDESNKGKVKDIANNPRSNAIALSDADTAAKVIEEMTPQAVSDFIDTAIESGKLTPKVSSKLNDHLEEKKRDKERQKDHELSRVEWFAHMMMKVAEAEKRPWGQRALMDLRDELNVRLTSFDDITPEMFTNTK